MSGQQTVPQQPSANPQDWLDYIKQANAATQETSSLLGNVWWGLKQGFFLVFLGLAFGAPLLMFRDTIRGWFEEGSAMQKWFDYGVAWLQETIFNITGSEIESLGVGKDSSTALVNATNELATPEKVGAEISRALAIADANTATNLGALAIEAAKRQKISVKELTTKENMQKLLLNEPDLFISMLDAMPKGANAKLVLSGNNSLGQLMLQLVQDDTSFNAIVADEDAKRVLRHAVKLSQPDDKVQQFENMLNDPNQHGLLRGLLIGLLNNQNQPAAQQAPTNTPPQAPTESQAPAPQRPAEPQTPATQPTDAPVTAVNQDFSEVLKIAASLNGSNPALGGELGALIGRHSGNQEDLIKAVLNYLANDLDGQALAQAIAVDKDTFGLLRRAGISLPDIGQIDSQSLSGVASTMVTALGALWNDTTPQQMMENAVDSAIKNQATLQQLAGKVKLDANGQFTAESIAAITPIIASAAATALG